jgi:hypothetical protein
MKTMGLEVQHLETIDPKPVFLVEELRGTTEQPQEAIIIQSFCDNKDKKQNTVVTILRATNASPNPPTCIPLRRRGLRHRHRLRPRQRLVHALPLWHALQVNQSLMTAYHPALIVMVG